METGFREETIIEKRDRLLSVVESVYNLDLKSKSRKKEYVAARISYCVILRDLGFGYANIGDFVGKVHATIIYYYNLFEIYKMSDVRFKSFHEKILYKFHKDDITVFDIEKIKLEKEVNVMSLRIKELDSQNTDLISKIKDMEEYNKKNESMHRLINHKITPKNKIEIELNLIRFFNGL
mgnify:FL=1|tara:strand:+ start:6409 stop:6945 length:537 start_codon:yes stop_codon:yes gene_type:complete